MVDRNIIPAFDLLLEELDAIVTHLNQQGAQLLQAKEYAQARVVIAKAEAVLAFQAKVKALQEGWVHLAVPPTPTTPNEKKPVNRTMVNSLEPGLRTPNEAFHLPILQALIQLGGSGRVSEVLEIVEEMMKDHLNQYDYEAIPSKPSIIRWRNNANWARLKLVQEGYLASDSPRGVWEITEKGQQRLENDNQS
jgi:restriction system protein